MKVLDAFERVFGCTGPAVFFSPGRVNLIGEHIDYNGGLVLPAAISFGTWLAIKPNRAKEMRMNSLNFSECARIPCTAAYARRGENWFNYPLGVIAMMQEDGHAICGLDLLFYGDIPIGCGLSSSASIEMVTAVALNELFGLGYSRIELVRLCQAVENRFIGVSCGIMDQFAVGFGQTGRALLLDCHTLEYSPVDCDLRGHVLAIINTNKPRKLSESKYNERVKECKEALRAFATFSIRHLCDLDLTLFNQYQHLIDEPLILNRARHVVEENDRVKLAADALASGDLVRFGGLMFESHRSLKELYEVSGPELDAVVAYCQQDPEVLGARMTGAGFGGCAIALVRESHFKLFSEQLCAYYQKEVGYPPAIYLSALSSGARQLIAYA